MGRDVAHNTQVLIGQRSRLHCSFKAHHWGHVTLALTVLTGYTSQLNTDHESSSVACNEDL